MLRKNVVAMVLAATVAVSSVTAANAVGPANSSAQGFNGAGNGVGPNGEHRWGQHRMDPQQRAERMFAMADTNHDGSVTRDEFMAAMKRRQERRQERMERRGGGPGGWQGNGPGRAPGM